MPPMPPMPPPPDVCVWVRRWTLTAPERIGEPAVDPAVQLLVEGPEDTGAELDEVDDEAAHDEHEAHQQLQDEEALQVG